MFKVLCHINDRIDLLAGKNCRKETVFLHAGQIIFIPVHLQDFFIVEVDRRVVLVIGPGRDAFKMFPGKKSIYIINCKFGNRLIRATQKVRNSIVVLPDRRFFEIPLFSCVTDLVKNIFIHDKTSLEVVLAVTTTRQEVRWHHNSDCGRRRKMLFSS